MKDFFVEMIRRWGAKQPWFFKALSTVQIVIAAVTGLPALIRQSLEWACVNVQLCYELPGVFLSLESQVLAIAAAVGYFVSKLTATSEDKVKRKIVD